MSRKTNHLTKLVNYFHGFGTFMMGIQRRNFFTIYFVFKLNKQKKKENTLAIRQLCIFEIWTL